MSPLLRLCSYGIGAIFAALGASVAIGGPNRAAAVYAFLLAAPFIAVGYVGGKPLPSVSKAEEEDRLWGIPAALFFVTYVISGGITLTLERFEIARHGVVHVIKGIAHVSGTIAIVLAFLTALYSTRLGQARSREAEKEDVDGG